MEGKHSSLVCAALSLSVVKGDNSLKNCKEKQGASVDA